MRATKLSGWAGHHKGSCFYLAASTKADVHDSLEIARRHRLSIAPCGGRNSFGDQIVNTGKIVLDCTGNNHDVIVNEDTGILEVSAGCTIRQVLLKIIPSGHILGGIPGALDVTIGGAIANNVHGKDSSVNGNFGAKVIWIELILADGSSRVIDRHTDTKLFLSTIGGMGLTGIIWKAGIELERITSSELTTEIIPCNSIEAACEIHTNLRDIHFAQGWNDLLARHQSCGRGFVTAARFEEFASQESRLDLDFDLRRHLQTKRHIAGLIPSDSFWTLMKPAFQRQTMHLINSAYYQYHSRIKKSVQKTNFEKFYFFHNNIPDFYRVYNPPGFFEIQALIPKDLCQENCRTLTNITKKNEIFIPLCGTKKMSADDFLISFQGDGVSISLDIPISSNPIGEIRKITKYLYDFIAEIGGKVNLSKDELLNYQAFRKMYPRWKEFCDIKAEYDRNLTFSHDMATRLKLYDD